MSKEMKSWNKPSFTKVESFIIDKIVNDQLLKNCI